MLRPVLAGLLLVCAVAPAPAQPAPAARDAGTARAPARRASSDAGVPAPARPPTPYQLGRTIATALQPLLPDAEAIARDELVVVLAKGAAPPWDDLRTLGRKVHDLVAAKLPGRTVEVWFSASGAVARASLVPGTAVVRVEVGDGRTMLDDRALYGVAARTQIVVKQRVFQGIPLGVEGRPTCSGEVENVGPVELEVAARCLVLGYTTYSAGGPVQVRVPGMPGTSEVLLDHAVPIGKLAPGARKKFKAKLPAMPKLKDGSRALSGLGAAVTLTVDGQPISHLDLSRFEAATAWLRVIEALRAEQLTVRTMEPRSAPAYREVMNAIELVGPDDLQARPAAELKALAKRVWKLLADHHKKFELDWVRYKVRSGRDLALLEDGKLGAFGASSW